MGYTKRKLETITYNSNPLLQKLISLEEKIKELESIVNKKEGNE